MIRTTIKCLLAFFAASIMMACGENDEDEDYDIQVLTFAGTEMQIMEKSDMPQWLAEKISEMETNRSSAYRAYIYQGKWNSETIYFFFIETTDKDNSSFYAYRKNGEQFDWKVYDLFDVYKNSSSWICIYLINPMTNPQLQ